MKECILTPFSTWLKAFEKVKHTGHEKVIQCPKCKQFHVVRK